MSLLIWLNKVSMRLTTNGMELGWVHHLTIPTWSSVPDRITLRTAHSTITITTPVLWKFSQTAWPTNGTGLAIIGMTHFRSLFRITIHSALLSLLYGLTVIFTTGTCIILVHQEWLTWHWRTTPLMIGHCCFEVEVQLLNYPSSARRGSQALVITAWDQSHSRLSSIIIYCRWTNFP